VLTFLEASRKVVSLLLAVQELVVEDDTTTGLFPQAGSRMAEARKDLDKTRVKRYSTVD
jgi:hypothetical protein